MKGIILAGGIGSRLYPVTKITNKHLLLVYNKPMIYYPLQTLVKTGLKDIIIVSGKEHVDQFKKLLTSNGQFASINFSFAVQKQAGGIAQALSVCKKTVKDDKIVVVLGDNIFLDDIGASLQQFVQQEKGAKVFLKEVTEPSKFCIAAIDDGKIIDMAEKPVSPKTNLAVTGLYMYDNQVWRMLEDLQPSFRGEMEITDVNNYYLKQNNLTFEILKNEWFDIDTFNELLKANVLIAKKEGLKLDY